MAIFLNPFFEFYDASTRTAWIRNLHQKFPDKELNLIFLSAFEIFLYRHIEALINRL